MLQIQPDKLEAFNQRVRDGNRQLSYRIRMNEKEVPLKQIMSNLTITTDGGFEEYSIGYALTSILEFTTSKELSLVGASIVDIEVGLGLDQQEVVWTSFQRFYVYDTTVEGLNRKVKCYDYMYRLANTGYFPSTNYTTTQEVCRDMSKQLNLAFTGAVNVAIDSSGLEGRTYKEVLGYLASAMGKNVRISRTNRIEFFGLSETGLSFGPGEYWTPTTNDSNYSITCLEVHYGEQSTNEDGGVTNPGYYRVGTYCSDAKTLVITNPLLKGKQDVATTVLNEIKDLSYSRFDTSYKVADYRLEVGDMVSFLINGVKIKVPILYTKYTLIYNNVNLEIQSPTKSEEKKEHNFKGILTQKVESLHANVLQVQHVIADKVSVGELKATVAEIERLYATKAEIGELVAGSIVVEELKAQVADIGKLVANKADITDLTVLNAIVNNLKAQVADIDNLIAGSILAEIIQSGSISSDLLNVKDGFIKDAMISSLSASKIDAGVINTNNVSIQSDNGNLLLQGNLLQFKDKNGKVRIQIGQDTKANYTFTLYDSTGKGVLINQEGIQSSNAIKDGLIVDSKVANNANIIGSKLNISSLYDSMNADGSKTLKASKVHLDDKGQTLDVSFKEMTSKQDDLQSSMNTAITDINVSKGQISQLIQDTTITTANGTTKLKDAYNHTKSTVDSHTTQIGKVENTLNSHNTQLGTVNKEVATLKVGLDGIEAGLSTLKQNVKNNYYTKTQTDSAIKVAKDSINLNVSSLEEKVDNIETNVVNTQIGGTNLFLETDYDNTTIERFKEKWYHSKTAHTVMFSAYTGGNAHRSDNLQFVGKNVLTSRINIATAISDGITQTSINPYGENGEEYIKLEPNTNYTLSFYAYVGGNAKSFNWTIWQYDDDGSNRVRLTNNGKNVTYICDTYTGALEYHEIHFTTSDKVNYQPRMYNNFKTSLTTGNSDIYLYHLKLEKGNKATDWTPSPQDITSDINTAKQQAISSANSTLSSTIANYYTKAQTDSQINIAKDAINLGVSNTYETKTNVTTKVNSAISTASTDATTKANNALSSAKTYADTKKTEAINSANSTLNSTIANYYTKTQTDSQINVAKNAITQSVANTYETKTDATSKINGVNSSISSLTTRMANAESKITDTAITNVVKQNFYTKTETDNQITSKGYQTASQVQQTVDALQLKFTQSGGFNLLYNSDFRRDTEKWGITSGAVYAINKGGLSCPNGTGIRFDGILGVSKYMAQDVTTNVMFARQFTASGYVYISNDGTDGSAKAFRLYVRLTYSDGTKTYHYTNVNQSSYNVWQRVYVTFNRDTSKTLTEIRFASEIKDTTRKMYLSQLMLEEGAVMSSWSPNPSEVYDGITTIDKDGIKVSTSKGAYTHFSADGMNSYDNSNRQTLGIRNGGMTFYAYDNNEYVGYISQSVKGTSSANGVSIGISPQGEYLSLGLSSVSDPNSGFAQTSKFVVARTTNTSESMTEGLNAYAHLDMHGWNLNNVNGVNVNGGINIKGNGMIKFDSASTYASAIWEDTGSGNLAVFGDNGVVLGYKDGATNTNIFKISETADSSSCRINTYENWNFNNWYLKKCRFRYDGFSRSSADSVTIFQANSNGESHMNLELANDYVSYFNIQANNYKDGGKYIARFNYHHGTAANIVGVHFYRAMNMHGYNISNVGNMNVYALASEEVITNDIRISSPYPVMARSGEVDSLSVVKSTDDVTEHNDTVTVVNGRAEVYLPIGLSHMGYLVQVTPNKLVKVAVTEKFDEYFVIEVDIKEEVEVDYCIKAFQPKYQTRTAIYGELQGEESPNAVTTEEMGECDEEQYCHETMRLDAVEGDSLKIT